MGVLSLNQWGVKGGRVSWDGVFDLIALAGSHIRPCLTYFFHRSMGRWDMGSARMIPFSKPIILLLSINYIACSGVPCVRFLFTRHERDRVLGMWVNGWMTG